MILPQQIVVREKKSVRSTALYNVVTSVPDRNELVWGCVGSPGVFPVGLEWSGRLSGSGWIWNDC